MEGHVNGEVTRDQDDHYDDDDDDTRYAISTKQNPYVKLIFAQLVKEIREFNGNVLLVTVLSKSCNTLQTYTQMSALSEAPCAQDT